MSEAFFFLSAMSSPSKSVKSLEEAPVPLQPSILWCVVWEKLLSGKMSQKIFFWAPSSPVLHCGYVSRILNIPLAQLWQAGACGSSSDLCLPPFTSCHIFPSQSSPDIPTPRVPVLWTPLQSSVQLTEPLSSFLGLCWGDHFMAETGCPCRPLWWPHQSKTDRLTPQQTQLLSLGSGENIYHFKVVFSDLILRQTPDPVPQNLLAEGLQDSEKPNLKKLKLEQN